MSEQWNWIGEDRKESCKILKPLIQALSRLLFSPLFHFKTLTKMISVPGLLWLPLMVLSSWNLRANFNHTTFDLCFLQPHPPSDSHLADGIVCGFLCPAFHVMPSTWLPENWVRCPPDLNSIFRHLHLPNSCKLIVIILIHPCLFLPVEGLPITTMHVYWRIASVSQADCTDLATMNMYVVMPGPYQWTVNEHLFNLNLD